MYNVYLFTVESYRWHGVGVLAILESVEDGGLPTSVKPDHHAMVASAAAEAHEALKRLLAHSSTHDGCLSKLFSLLLLLLSYH